jgi:hypothetical protein
MIYGELRFTNSVGLNHVGDANGNSESVITWRFYGNWINRGLHHLNPALSRPARTSRNEWARFGKRDRGFDNSQSSLLGNGGDFSYFGIRNYPVPIATYTVAKFLGRMALLRCWMLDQNRNYVQLVRNCDDLMKNAKLSLYEEVELIKREAQKAQTNVGLLRKLRIDLSFLIDRLSSTEKVTYLRCCENEKATSMWESTEP